MRRHTTGVLAVIPVLLLALSACGGGGTATEDVASVSGGNGSASPSPSTSAEDPEEQGLKFAQCMREHGIDMPDPDSEGRIRMRAERGQDEQKLDEAMKACEQYSPKIGGKGGKAMSKEDQEALLAFARCMREHGIDMPDPDFSGGLAKQKLRGKVRPDDQKFKDAEEACQDKLPARPRSGGGAGGSGGGK
jgi:hypothetical protein